jgi:predicted amidophosphoribosyltransferase
LPQLDKVDWGNTKRILDRLGLGWLFESKQEIEKITLTDLSIIPLKEDFDFGYALGLYSEPKNAHREKTPVGGLLYRFKYQFNQDAGAILADLAVELINRQNLLRSSDFIVTVPPSFTSRPFDPISFLAERISFGTGIRWEKGVIKRTRITGQQKRIFDKEAKKENVELTFALHDPLLIKDKKILLLDDLYDSGVTINQISQILRQAGADKIFVVVLAKTSYV